jgi:hypothetical protein
MRVEEVFIVVFTLLASVWLLTPVARALAERIKPRSGALESAALEELRRLRDEVVEEVSLLRREVAELGERVDFAERLLAKQSGQALPRAGA